MSTARLPSVAGFMAPYSIARCAYYFPGGFIAAQHTFSDVFNPFQPPRSAEAGGGFEGFDQSQSDDTLEYTESDATDANTNAPSPGYDDGDDGDVGDEHDHGGDSEMEDATTDTDTNPSPVPQNPFLQF